MATWVLRGQRPWDAESRRKKRLRSGGWVGSTGALMR
jgi:hypothetical protein